MAYSGAFVSHVLREVPASAAMDALGVDAGLLGQSVSETLEEVAAQWRLLEDAFQLIPAVPLSNALESPLLGTSIYAEVMGRARTALCNASFDVFEPLERTREDLQGRIDNLNERHAMHQATLDAEISMFRSDPDADPRITGRNHPETDAYRTAEVNLSLLNEEAELLALDVEAFHRALDGAEASLASTLRGIVGGDAVSRADGSEVHTSQLYWGLISPGASRGVETIREPVGLAEYFAQSMLTPVDARIRWLADADRGEVEGWLDAHPEFMETVGFVPPVAAAALFAKLKAASTQGRSGAWVTGPLAGLSAHAPGAIGNLNGLKASERSPFSEQELQRLLADPHLTGDQKSKLTLLDRKTSDANATLLSVFLDADGDPRASLAWGDPDTADQVITITHGIATDLGQLDEWATIGDDLTVALEWQTGYRHSDSSTAVVLFMEWDSGSQVTVQGADLPQDGAAREVALVEGMRFVNPNAWQEGWAHSLGATETAGAVLQSPDVFDHVSFFGSAGLTSDAAENLEALIRGGDVTASATSADLDWVATLGRVPGVSAHAVNPLDLSGVDVFGSNGGKVDGYLTDGGGPVVGLPTQGHNAGASADLLYRLHRIDTVATAVGGVVGGLLTLPAESVGYLDPRSQSFMQAVADFMNRVEEHG